MAGGSQHDVVVVAVADAQHIGGHAAACARVDEVLGRLVGPERKGRFSTMLSLAEAVLTVVWFLKASRCHHLFVLVLGRVVLAEPLGQRLVFEGARHAVLHLNLSKRV